MLKNPSRKETKKKKYNEIYSTSFHKLIRSEKVMQ